MALSLQMRPAARKQVLAIGAEVGNFEFIRAALASGKLPVLASLASEGSLLPMTTVTEISSGSIWPSFATATNPLKHGQFFTHMQLRSGTYRIDKKYADDIPVEFFWEPLGRAGMRVFSFDVAQTRPIAGFNGVNLCAWGSEYPAWPRSSSPKPLMKELVGRYGSHPLVDQYRLSIRPESEEEHRAFYEKLTTGLERKGNICLDILKREPWDLSVIVFPEVHWAMHLLWQTYDRDHPAFDPGLELPFDDIFLTLYGKLDEWIGRFLEVMPGSSVLVFSGSGFGPNYSGWHLLPEVLQRLGLAADPTAKRRSLLAAVLPMKKWGAYKIRRTEDLLSLPVIETLKRILPKSVWDKGTRRLLYAGNRWAESRAFCLPNDYTGAIRINLKGREPQGVVAAGEEYESLIATLSRELRALVNPATGRPAVARVVRPDREYPGAPLGDFPDLIVVWANDAPITSLASPAIGTVSGDFPERRSGAHRNDCFVLSNEKLAAPAANGGASLVDIAPTIYRLLSQQAPAHFDGQPLTVQ
jgi:predicted AlkP superfamily phosphohydrolase/phosphomutase